MIFGEKNIRIRESPPPLYLRVGKTGKNYITDVAYPPPPHPHVDSQTSIFRLAFIPSPPPPFLGPLSRPHTYMHHAGPQESGRREGTASFRIPTPKFLKALHQTWATEGLGGGGITPCMWLERIKKRNRFLFYHPPSGFNNEH